MWVIFAENNSDQGERIRLLVGRTYTVGRKGCDITILNDQSISRKHAELTVMHAEAGVGHPHLSPVLTLKDCSKLGTMVGPQRHKATSVEISSCDTLLFGTLGTSKYKAVYEPYIVTTSCLDVAAKRSVKKLIVSLGAHLVSDWRKDCQLLVMSSLSVTVKVICAMISQKDIVTPSYLEDFIKAVESKAKEPDPADYTPTLMESQLDPNEVSFKRDEKRRTLLQGKIFIFLNPKQFKKLSMAIELAGGTPMLMEEGTDDNEDDILVGSDSCVMYCDQADQTQNLSQNAQDWVTHVEEVLRRHKKRFINDSEIGYAVLYCCTDKYCNPNCDIGGGNASSCILSQTVSQRVDFSDVPQSQTSRIGQKRNGGIQLTEAAVQVIKEEPASQQNPARITPGVKQQTTSHGARKRPHRSDDESQPTPKSIKRDQGIGDARPVKQEKETPQKAVQHKASPVRGSHSKGCSPDPGPSKQRAQHERSPSQIDAVSPIRGRTQSPAASSSKKPSNLKQESVDPFDELESVRPSRRNRLAQRRGWDSDVDDEPDCEPADPFAELDDISWSKSVASISREASLTAKHKRQIESPPEGNKERLAPSKTLFERSAPQKAPTESPCSSHTRRELSGSLHPEDDKPLGIGFLTTLKPLKDQPGAERSDYEVDESLPVKVVTTQEVPLIFRKPRQSGVRSTGNPATWKGRRVKNFKKFRKTQNVGTCDLPCIIGGTDLVAYNGASKKLENMFEQTMAMESQQNEEERQTRDLFNWDPPKKRGRR